MKDKKVLVTLSKKQDRELVELLIGGSRDALGELYARYKKRLMYTCIQYLRDDIDAEDIVHDIFLQLWEKRHYLNPELSFLGYMQTIVQNNILKKIRHFDVHSRFSKNILTYEIDSTNETEDTIIANDYARLLDKLIERLPPKQKEIFRLSRIEGRTYKEISELLHISDENVRNQISLALKKIKDQLLKHIDIKFQIVIIILMFFL